MLNPTHTPKGRSINSLHSMPSFFDNRIATDPLQWMWFQSRILVAILEDKIIR
jgi:lauroyl/myristoyl acyltransferase